MTALKYVLCSTLVLVCASQCSAPNESLVLVQRSARPQGIELADKEEAKTSGGLFRRACETAGCAFHILGRNMKCTSGGGNNGGDIGVPPGGGNSVRCNGLTIDNQVMIGHQRDTSSRFIPRDQIIGQLLSPGADLDLFCRAAGYEGMSSAAFFSHSSYGTYRLGLTSSGQWTSGSSEAFMAHIACYEKATPSPTPQPTPSPTQHPTETPAPTTPPPTPEPTTPTAVASQSGASASGDPHVVNVHGEKFDLLNP